MKHTPAPWYAVEYGGWWMVQDGPSYEDLDILNAEHVTSEVAEANAKLSAAAPDLLEAVQRLINCVENRLFISEDAIQGNWFDQIKTLVKKVTE